MDRLAPVRRARRLAARLRTLRDGENFGGEVSLDHLVGEREQLCRHVEAERLGGHDTEHQLVLGWQLDRQVAWLRAPENGCRVMRAGAAIRIGVACAVAHQTASQDKLANAADRRHAMTRGERRQLPAPVVEQNTATDKQRTGARLNDGCKCSIDFAFGLRVQDQELTPEFARSRRHLFFFHFESRSPGIAQPSNGGWWRHQLMQQRQALWRRGADAKLTPVILPPGRLRLLTRPVAIGSPPLTNTIGMVEVAARAALMTIFGPTIM